jgi:hypothetical protein
MRLEIVGPWRRRNRVERGFSHRVDLVLIHSLPIPSVEANCILPRVAIELRGFPD